MNYRFYTSCIAWPPLDIQRGLLPMQQQAVQITRNSFMTHVSKIHRQVMEANMGYALHCSQGLTIAGDPHVKYFRSMLHGQRVYFITWSGIELVYTLEGKHPLDKARPPSRAA
jgi:hypothetical protein